MATKKTHLTKSSVDKLAASGKVFRVWDTGIPGFHVRVSPTGSKSFVLRYHNKGRNLDYTIGRYGDVTPAQARQKAVKLRGQARGEGIDLLADRRLQKEAEEQALRQRKRDALNTLGNFYDRRYGAWAKTNLKTDREIDRLLGKDFAFLRNRKLIEITPWVVTSWVRKSKEAGLSNASINRRITVLKSILSKAVEWEVIETSPLAGMKREKVDALARVRYLDAEEESRLRSALDDRQTKQRTERENFNEWRKARKKSVYPEFSGEFSDYLKPLVLIAMNTGMRRGELFDLRWEDVNTQKSFLTVRGWSNKTGRTRHIPLNTEACQVFVGWREISQHTALVFPSPRTGGRLDNINSSWAGLMEAADITNFRFHDLRHHFASRLVMEGVDLNTARELLGHTSIETTLRYAHLAPEHKAAAVEAISRAS